MTALKHISSNVNYNRFKKDVEKLLAKHAGHLPAVEMLAMSAKLTGMILALQDQRTMTGEQGIQIVTINIELGNRLIVGKLSETEGLTRN